ncbi:unnamed protein product [Oncorhynchus mykiss]|uniref:Vitellogenin domain-containing protein n=1 Tax=Oncorhynchus mykiss TaxID=8022 RepID=A0A060WEF7_ONCMY|nr:unnamed protein product [Oncorhynchus mykiss]
MSSLNLIYYNMYSTSQKHQNYEIVCLTPKSVKQIKIYFTFQILQTLVGCFSFTLRSNSSQTISIGFKPCDCGGQVIRCSTPLLSFFHPHTSSSMLHGGNHTCVHILCNSSDQMTDFHRSKINFSCFLAQASLFLLVSFSAFIWVAISEAGNSNKLFLCSRGNSGNDGLPFLFAYLSCSCHNMDMVFYQIGLSSSVYHPYLVTTQLIGLNSLRNKIPQMAQLRHNCQLKCIPGDNLMKLANAKLSRQRVATLNNLKCKINCDLFTTFLKNPGMSRCVQTFDWYCILLQATNNYLEKYAADIPYMQNLRAEASVGVEVVTIKMETNADHSENRIYSLVTASLDVNGLAVNSDATVKLLENKAAHKATLTMNKDGLATSGTTTLQGPLKGAYGEEELKHTYEINYADLTANAKCSTTGKLLGAHMSHNTELEIVGLAAKVHNDARFNSQPFRFDNTIRASIIPFDFNLDAIFNADGDLTLYGKQSAQLYGKFLLKAQPLAFASSHECRASVTQHLDNGFPLETTIDNKIDTLLTPHEQRAILRMKSKLNSHALNQEVSAYNNAERLGLELSATLLTGLLNTAASEDQEFTISGFLKYDKNTDSHLINLPFLKSLPAILENIKITIVNMAEAIQNYINSDEVKAKLEALPHHVSDFVAKLNLEDKAVQLKQNLIALTKDYPITLEYLEVSLLNLKITGIVAATKEMIASGTLSETVIERLSQELNAINEEYKITTMIIPTLQIPKIKLPAIPSEISVPCFGKLYGEIKVSTPIYSIRTSAELQNSTDSEETPQLTAFLTSQAISPIFEIFSYNLDSTARVAIPKFNRVIVAETLKFTHTALAVEHQASATTAHYTADIVNNAFFATLGGMSASVDTTYNHQINIPILGFTNGASVTQKAVARLEDTTITLTIGNDGAIKSNSHKGTHKCDLHFAISPSTTKLTISVDSDTALLKMKQTMNADAVILSHITFEARSEAEGPAIKNSLLVASGNANLGDMKVELKANHDTELVGDLSGILSNSLTVKIHPIEVVFDFQNKGNTKLSFNEALMAKIDLQNDYSAIIKPEAQQINTVALARFNQYKSSYNFTIDNNKKEAGIFATVNSEANLEFLTNPFSIPEIDLPFINLHIPAISDLNLYEHTGLKNILTTTEQSLDVDSKILYQKSHFHSLGNLITELSLKSPIFNLNANAGLYTEDDLVFRLRATTASVFEALKTKLDGTTSLTTKRGLKLATALSLENAHIEGNHDSTFSLSTDNLEAAVSVATIAKIALPIFNLEANQKLVADTKTKPNAASTLKLKGDFNLPLIKAIGKAEADHSLKLEGTLEYISVESSIKGTIDGTILEYNAVLGALHNEANIYLNADGLRSTSKIIANAKLSNGETTILEMDVDENLAVEASVSRVYAVLKFASNNEANVITFNTKGKHVAQATIDFAPLTSLTADVEINMSQPSNMGDISLFEKTAVELTCTKQKISTTAKIATPVYTTNLAAELKGDAPVFKAELKSSATSVINFLDYDVDASFTASFENEALSVNGKAVLNHADLTMDIQNVITQAMR